jgi:citrate lyase beta subunit
MNAAPQGRRRRSVLSVPASDPRKLAKAWTSGADEVVVDLEDAVAPGDKDASRQNIAGLPRRDRGLVAVRINAIGTPWHDSDLEACAANPHVQSVVLPKAEDPGALADLCSQLGPLAQGAGRTCALGVQALVESAAGIHAAVDLARASDRIVALILGYADLAASMGRRPESSWQFAQDAVVMAARMAGIQAIDGPVLTIADDERLAQHAAAAEELGFDGKWVIHPAQVDTVTRTFTPSAEEEAEAREIIEVLRTAGEQGSGAVQWRGRMLDEAVAVRARRTLQRTASDGKDLE